MTSHQFVGTFLLAWTLSTSAAPPEPPVLRPAAVVLHVHDALPDTRFLPELQRRLSNTLAVPVSTRPIVLDLAPMQALIGPMDPAPLLEQLANRFSAPSERAVVHAVLIDADIRLQPARFNFAASAGSATTPFHVTVVSLARLRKTDRQGTDPAPDLSAERAFKLIAKNVARLMGYAGSTQCLFAFPRNLAELDATPENFCEPDLSHLIAAGIARRLP